MAKKCPKCHFENPDNQKFCLKCATPLKAEEGISITKTLKPSVRKLEKEQIIAERYRIIEKIGEGGMGVVYKAEDTRLERTVALKFLPPEFTQDSEARERFIQEAKAASALDHNNICTIYEIDAEAGEQVFIAMAYYEGESIKEKIKQGPLEQEEALNIALQVAQGLSKAHKKGIIHRDIKPANIINSLDEVAKILDFGLAKLSGQVGFTKTRTVMGTAAYMSPEQAKGEETDQRTDIWSLGVMLYEMLSGKLPFKGENEQSIIYSILNKEPEPLDEMRGDLPEGLVQIITKMLAKNPALRYQEIDELIVDLTSILEGIEPEWTESERFKRKISRRKKIVLYAVIAISLVIIAVFLTRLLTGPKEIINSIAILPFHNVNEDPEIEYLCTGIPEVIINKISQLPNIKRVIALQSVLNFAGQSIDPRTVGKDLDVKAVLTTRIIKQGNTLSVRPALVKTADASQLWGEKYDFKLEDIMTIEERIIPSIIKTVGLKPTEQEELNLMKRYTENFEAYQLYLKGRHFTSGLNMDMMKAIKSFNQAIDKDPTYALAYSGLAQCYSLMALFGIQPPRELYQKAKTNAEKALQIDDNLAEAYSAAASVNFWFDWNWQEAGKNFTRAIELSPGRSAAYQDIIPFLIVMDREDDAIAYAREQLESNPLDLYAHHVLGWTYWSIGEIEKSIAKINEIFDLDPNYILAHLQQAWNYAFKKMHKEALAECKKIERISTEFNPWPRASIAYVYAVSGEVNKTKEILKKFEELDKDMYIDPFNYAVIYTGLGDMDKAFEWLIKAYEIGSPQMVYIKEAENPWNFLGSLRSDPRMIQLQKKMNLD